VVKSGVPDGGLFDPTCGIASREEAEKLTWEILEPHLAEAKKATTIGLIRSPEWTGRLSTKRPKGPVPELHAQTPFFSVVYALTSAREQYADVLLSDLDELSKQCSLRMVLLDRMPQDVELWKVVIDPDNLRLKPDQQSAPYSEIMEDRYYYSITWQFTASAVSAASLPLVVALLRLGYDELRFEFSKSMR
jgi:hypothetical protein